MGSNSKTQGFFLEYSIVLHVALDFLRSLYSKQGFYSLLLLPLMNTITLIYVHCTGQARRPAPWLPDCVSVTC